MKIIVLKNPISRQELLAIAKEGFGNMVKATVDIDQKIMAVGGELHADEEVTLTESYGSKGANTWGINIYPEKSGEEMVEFNSMINIKPAQGNRSRGVENEEVRKKILGIIKKLIPN